MHLPQLTAPRGLSRRDDADRRSARLRRRRLASASLVLLALALPVASAHAAGTQAIVGWGNTPGGLGVTDFGSPTSLPSATGAIAAAIAGERAFILTPSGVLGVGEANYGQLGLGSGVVPAPSAFTAIPGTAGATQVSTSSDATLVLVNGTVLAFGHNGYGDAGAAPGTIVGTPTAVPGLTGTFVQVASGQGSSYALRSDGTLWAWGRNDADQLGDISANIGTPRQVQGLGPVKAIAAGYDHVLALLQNGTVWAWGDNEAGELGNGAEAGEGGEPVATPVQVFTPPAGTTVSSISAGEGDSFALLSDGSFRAWGENWAGQLGLGIGNAENQDTPTASAAPSSLYPTGGFTAISAGLDATYGIGADGHVYAWGNNTFGQLGTSTYSQAFPYGSVSPEEPQMATEIPQPVGELTGVSWLADTSFADGQIIAAQTPVQWYGSNTGGDPRTTDASKFVTQTVGSLSFTHTFYFESLGLDSTVTKVRLTGPDARDFLLVGYESEEELPFTLTDATGGDGTSLGVQIRFAPSDVGERSATLEVDTDTGTVDVPLTGEGLAPTGGPAGTNGTNGANGANGATIVGPSGPAGANGARGPAGKNGVITFAAKAAKVSVKPGHAASLRFVLGNGTTGGFPKTTLSVKAPKGLHVLGGRFATVASLAAGKSRTVTLKLKVGAKARRGVYRVEVTWRLGGRTVTRNVQLRVT